MSLLSKSGSIFARQEAVSKSYEYKLKSAIKKKVANHFDKRLLVIPYCKVHEDVKQHHNSMG